jgi:hypothetical protein
MMFYERNYRNTRTASALAVLLVLMGMAFLFGFLFIRFDSGVGGGDGDFNWSLVAIFIPVFMGSFASIMAAISSQRRKQQASFMVQNQHLEMEIEEKTQERIEKQADRNRRPNLIYCNYCGEKLEREAHFCPQCGTKMRI